MKRISFPAVRIAAWDWCKKILPMTGAYFLVELLGVLLLRPADLTALAFGIAWAVLLASVGLLLPRLLGRIWFGLTYYFFLLWTLAQTGYDRVFGKMMWLSDVVYAGEGATFFADILGKFPLLWWVGGAVLLALGVIVLLQFPREKTGLLPNLLPLVGIVLAVVALLVLPRLVFTKDSKIWGTRSEYGQSSSYRATYQTMYDAKKTYNICGIYHTTVRDIWRHEIYTLTPAYRKSMQEQKDKINQYFAQRGTKEDNAMTGIFQDKNVVLVLMESMDDWMITPTDTPTLYRLMEEGINFTNFYTPGYGTARTINSEFCVNTGIYLPTNGHYVFDYVTNAFNQSIASQATDNGYSAEVFHYNDPAFYSRGVFEPAMGYNAYNYYGSYTEDENLLYDDCALFEIPELQELFFREGKTFNTIITRSAHLSYKYNEVLSAYALKKYPQYRGLYGSQEEDCARVKAKLVDDMFARLLQELKKRGQLENTVIIGVTDHYTYGYKNTEELYALSGIEHTLMLEKTPCFVWAADAPAITVDKTLNTADFLPTMLNLLGFDSPYSYLGQDAFDPDYSGYALFPDGSWIADGIVCNMDAGGKPQILHNETGSEVTREKLDAMAKKHQEFVQISNLLLTTDYYRQS